MHIFLLDSLMKRQVGKAGKQRLEPTKFGNFVPICSGRILFNRSKDSQSYVAIVMVAFVVSLHCRHWFLLSSSALTTINLCKACWRHTDVIGRIHLWVFFSSVLLHIFCNGALTPSFRRCVSFLLLSWLTEPGLCERKNEEEEPAPEVTEDQRKVASLMACVRNNKIQLITVPFRIWFHV